MASISNQLTDEEALAWIKNISIDPYQMRFGAIIGDKVLFNKSGSDKTTHEGTLVGWKQGKTGINMMIEPDDPDMGTVYTRPALVWIKK